MAHDSRWHTELGRYLIALSGVQDERPGTSAQKKARVL